MLQSFCNVYLIADPCYNNQNMGDANRKGSYTKPHWSGPVFCDDLFPERWYRFKGAKEQANCFRAVRLINWNIRDKMYVSNI